jgi:hypothetical protein
MVVAGFAGALSILVRSLFPPDKPQAVTTESITKAVAAVLGDHDAAQKIEDGLHTMHAEVVWFASQPADYVDGTLSDQEAKAHPEDVQRIKQHVERNADSYFNETIEWLAEGEYGVDAFQERSLDVYIFATSVHLTFCQTWTLLDEASGFKSPFVHQMLFYARKYRGHIQDVMTNNDARIDARTQGVAQPKEHDFLSSPSTGFGAPATFTRYVMVEDAKASEYPTTSTESFRWEYDAPTHVVYRARCDPPKKACGGDDCTAAHDTANRWRDDYLEQLQTAVRTRYVKDDDWAKATAALDELDRIINTFSPLDPQGA